MMRKVFVLAISAALVLGTATQASAAVKIVKIRYDSPGTDTGTNDSLNAEWIQIHNGGDHNSSIWKWRIRDASGHVFVFPNIKLTPGQDVRVHTGGGFDSFGDAIHLFWGSSSYIWNNGGDTAKLIRRDGSLASKCRYVGPSLGYKVC